MSDPTNISGVNLAELKLTLGQAKELLQDRVKQLEAELAEARAELCRRCNNDLQIQSEAPYTTESKNNAVCT